MEDFDITKVPAFVRKEEPIPEVVAPPKPPPKVYKAVPQPVINYGTVQKADVTPADIAAQKRARADAYTESLKAKTATNAGQSAAEYYESLKRK